MWTQRVHLVASTTTRLCRSIRPSSGRRHKYINGKVCCTTPWCAPSELHHTVMCPLSPSKSMSLNEPIFIKLTVTKQIVPYRIVFRSVTKFRKYEKILYFSHLRPELQYGWLPLLRIWLIWYLQNGIMWGFSVPSSHKSIRNYGMRRYKFIDSLQ